MKKHIIFDFDDTISSSCEHNQKLFAESILVHKANCDRDYLNDLHYRSRGKDMWTQFDEVIKKYSLPLKAEQLVKENELLHQKQADKVRIFVGFEELLKKLKSSGKVISLCTNRNKKSLDLILKKNKIHRYFDNIVSCIDEGHEKPDPFCLTMLLKKYPMISKSESIYFGDSKTDAEFAKASKIDFLIIDHYLNDKKVYKSLLESLIF